MPSLKSTLDGKQPPSLTEPVIRECLYMTGGAIDVSEGTVRLVAWVEAPDLGGQTTERRIVARLAMTKRTARAMVGQITEYLGGS